MIDTGEFIFYANPAAENLFGFSVTAEKQLALADILPEDSSYRTPKNLADLWRRAEETEHIENLETQLFDKDGKVFEINQPHPVYCCSP